MCTNYKAIIFQLQIYPFCSILWYWADTLQSTFLPGHLAPCWAQPIGVRGRQQDWGWKKGLLLPVFFLFHWWCLSSSLSNWQRQWFLSRQPQGVPTLVQPGTSQGNRNDTKLMKWKSEYVFVVVQLLSCVWLFATAWTAACQASLSFTISQSLPKLMSIELVIPSNLENWKSRKETLR